MGLRQRLKFFLFEKLYGKKIYKSAEEWHEKVKDWNIDKWKEYWISTLNKLLEYPWNSEFYKVKRIETLEDLLELPVYSELPTINYRGKILGNSVTSGTTGKPKVIPFSKEDWWRSFKTFRFYIRNRLHERNLLFVSTGMRYTSGQYFEIAKRIIRAGGGNSEHLSVVDIKKGKRPKLSIEVLTTIFCHLYPIMRNIEKNAFSEDVDVVLSGDAITDVILQGIKKIFDEMGVGLAGVFNMYGSSEVVGIMASSNRDSGTQRLEVYPEVLIPFYRKVKVKEGTLEISTRIYPLWEAKSGEEGYFVLTSLRSYLLINYEGLKDFIRIVGHRNGIPEIFPVGRVGSKVNIGYSKVLKEEISGYHGVIVRTAGALLNYEVFVSFLSKLYPKTRFFVFAKEKDLGSRADIIIYSDNDKVDLKRIKEEMKKSKKEALEFFLLDNFDISVEYNPNFIKEIYEELPNLKAEREESPKIIPYIVKKVGI